MTPRGAAATNLTRRTSLSTAAQVERQRPRKPATETPGTPGQPPDRVAGSHRVVPFFADCIAVALGYTCHPGREMGSAEAAAPDGACSLPRMDGGVVIALSAPLEAVEVVVFLRVRVRSNRLGAARAVERLNIGS